MIQCFSIYSFFKNETVKEVETLLTQNNIEVPSKSSFTWLLHGFPAFWSFASSSEEVGAGKLCAAAAQL
jgi:hypothetical protein